MTKIRTRFAPSPTGYMHIGNLRTALYCYLIAKHQGGDFILRIEDTDQNREVEGATQLIYDILTETGLNWDEGPDKPGDCGPYIQSERLPIYHEYAKKLIELGGAHYCFCDKDADNDYDPCRMLDQAEIDEKLAAGVPYVIRQTIPDKGKATFDDEIYGHIEVDCTTLNDSILIKSDGFPTYNFANVVDDHLMGITHVVRGNEYLASTPKYNLLYDAYGWDRPTYIHLPPVMKDEHAKLSKRNGDASYQDLTKQGYLKDAILNYIALLGWSPADEEILSLNDLIEQFNIEHISKAPAIFDIDKFTSFEGDTGPYILYTIVRIKSILAKAKEQGEDLTNLTLKEADTDSQKALMMTIARFNAMMENAYDEVAPHKICAYIYDLANAFNRFYHETKILAEEDAQKKAGYIALLKLTKDVLETCIDLLGFEAPERM